MLFELLNYILLTVFPVPVPATEIQMMYIPKTFTSHSSCMYVEYAKLICFGHK